MKLKKLAIVIEKLEELMEYYAGQSMFFEEKGNDEKSFEMAKIYDKIEEFKEFLESL